MILKREEGKKEEPGEGREVLFIDRLGKTLKWYYLNQGWVCTKLNGVKTNFRKYNVLVNLESQDT